MIEPAWEKILKGFLEKEGIFLWKGEYVKIANDRSLDKLRLEKLMFIHITKKRREPENYGIVWQS